MKFNKIALLIGLIGLSVSCSSDENTVDPVVTNPEDVEYKKSTYIYKIVETENLKLDIYTPEETNFAQMPVLVYYHSGGFTQGTRLFSADWIPWDIATYFLSKGYTVASVSYRLIDSEKGTSMVESFIDSKDAIRWLRLNPQNLAIDTDNIGVFGYSAGGRIVNTLAVSEDTDFIGDSQLQNYSSKVNYALSMCGGGGFELWDSVQSVQDYNDLTLEQQQGLREGLHKIGLDSDETDITVIKNRINMLSLAIYFDEFDAPISILHGENDYTVAVEESYRLAEELEKVGVDYQLNVLEGQGHSFGFTLPQEEKLYYTKELFEFALNYYK